MKCIKCGNVDNKPFLKCDGCERPVHSECSGLNASELKVMGLKGSRLLKFYCEDCTTGVRLVPQLIKKLDELQNEVNLLKRNNLGNETMIPSDSILTEIEDRQKRANNIMLFNLPESHDDTVNAKEILKLITNDDITVQKAVRVGKPNKNGFRALKLTVNSSKEAEKVITAKKGVLKGRGVYVSADLTPQQCVNIKKLRQEVDSRKRNGENVILKFIKGVPRIIDDNSNSKN